MLQKKKRRRARRVHYVSTVMMGLCFLVATVRLVAGVLPVADPRLASAGLACTFWECDLDRSPLRLLPLEGGQPRLVVDAGVLDAVIDRPQARTMIAAGALTAALPASWMFFSLALAFREFGRRRDLSRAVTWLRRAPLGALGSVVLRPVADTLRATALSPASLGEQRVYVMFDGANFLWGIIIAGTALVAVWVLEETIQAKRTLAEIV